MYAVMTKTWYERKPGTRTVWQEVKSTREEFTEEQYRNYVDAAPFFRRLGGSNTLTRGYTARGYIVVRIVSMSPDRTERRVAEFEFPYPADRYSN